MNPYNVEYELEQEVYVDENAYRMYNAKKNGFIVAVGVCYHIIIFIGWFLVTAFTYPFPYIIMYFPYIILIWAPYYISAIE